MDQMLTPTQVDPALKGSLNGSARAAVRAATNLLKRDRRAGAAALDTIFQAGLPPGSELDGRFMGELYIANIAPLLTMLAARTAESWRPWRGKIFFADRHAGENFFSRSSFILAHLVWPLYWDYKPDGPRTYRAFPFVTRLGAGRIDKDRQVLKIDYDIPGNPGQSVRRLLDELVQVGHDFYLGKAHLQWWWGRWQQVAFFTLEKGERPSYEK